MGRSPRFTAFMFGVLPVDCVRSKRRIDTAECRMIVSQFSGAASPTAHGCRGREEGEKKKKVAALCERRSISRRYQSGNAYCFIFKTVALRYFVVEVFVVSTFLWFSVASGRRSSVVAGSQSKQCLSSTSQN